MRFLSNPRVFIVVIFRLYFNEAMFSVYLYYIRANNGYFNEFIKIAGECVTFLSGQSAAILN